MKISFDYTMPDLQARKQIDNAERISRIYHLKMLEAGYEWDGMDGYSAPCGTTKEDADRLWREALDEARS
jgi:hypothetical protein